jgi:hypothetical protein
LIHNETLHVFAVCFNEELLLPYFIEHYKKQGADYITVFDNYSTDKSKQIILDHGCQYIPYDSGGQIRDDIYLDIKNNCWKPYGSDWMIVCDIDEFLYLPKQDLSTCDMVKSIGWDVLGLPHATKGLQNPLYSKQVLFRRKNLIDINYSAGCHTCRPHFKHFKDMLGFPDFKANLLHYAHITPEHKFQKYCIYQSRLSDINKQKGWGSQYVDVTPADVEANFEYLRANSSVILF